MIEGMKEVSKGMKVGELGVIGYGQNVQCVGRALRKTESPNFIHALDANIHNDNATVYCTAGKDGRIGECVAIPNVGISVGFVADYDIVGMYQESTIQSRFGLAAEQCEAWSIYGGYPLYLIPNAHNALVFNKNRNDRQNKKLKLGNYAEVEVDLIFTFEPDGDNDWICDLVDTTSCKLHENAFWSVGGSQICFSYWTNATMLDDVHEILKSNIEFLFQSLDDVGVEFKLAAISDPNYRNEAVWENIY